MSRRLDLRAAEAAPALSVSLVVHDRGPEAAERYAARLADYPLLVETGRTPWEAVSRLVGAHRALLERRWSR